MNQQTNKTLKAGIIAAIVGMIISAAVSRQIGANLDVVQLVSGGATVGLITLVLTIIISTMTAARKSKI